MRGRYGMVRGWRCGGRMEEGGGGGECEWLSGEW